ncbi:MULTISPECIES: helix-turn-helix transcriptional regulator [Nocardioides]|uniref:LuxR C-terminal-related transcriptional regulator n=1 Tax=Nocardioides vastitatis TaxID=2568655 RepID=A0ABW0ZFS1_9ACTN|nr:helix-turn-helix transcriptional regulator [Nocardioides sp.]THI93469.1 helix-turn-helix transcriptional regulator [Nocardioides sp.]
MDLIGRAERLCGAGLPDRVLRERLLAAVAAAVPFDAHVFTLTDPVTRVASSPHATVPTAAMEQLPTLIRQRYASADAVDWLRWLGRFGVTDLVRVPFEDRYGAWGWLELWRTGGAPYSQDDRAVLAALRPAVTRGLRLAAARTFVDPAADLPQIEPGVLVLDRELRVQSLTDAAGAALLRLLPPDEPVPPVPAAAYNVGAALLARDDDAQPWEPSTRVHLGGNRWVSVRAAPLGSDVAVSIGPATAAERTDLLARVHALSPRETEVLGLAVHGLDSRAIASRLVIAPTTAEDHLRALLAKTGSPSRQVLMSRVLGT